MSDDGIEAQGAKRSSESDDDREFSSEVRTLLTYPDRMREAYNELSERALEAIDPFISGCRSLLIAHGAAIFASLQMLLSAEGTRARTIAGFAGAFCFGFLFACLGLFFGSYARASASARYWEKKEVYRGKVDGYLMIGFCILSFTILGGAAMLLGKMLLGFAFGFDDLFGLAKPPP